MRTMTEIQIADVVEFRKTYADARPQHIALGCTGIVSRIVVQKPGIPLYRGSRAQAPRKPKITYVVDFLLQDGTFRTVHLPASAIKIAR